MSVEVHGFCDERFLPLKEAFAANFADGLEVGASLALLRHGQPMVDIWAGYADPQRTQAWDRDTIVPVASITKIAVALSLLMLVDRGLVDLDATVATYWPEFAAGGKSRVTVREAMSHRAGVPGFDPPVAYEAQHDWAGITRHIAAEQHWFGGDSVLCYHVLTYGLILGEIVRRVDGRGPAAFFREEVAERAGIDLQIGLRSQAERSRVARRCYIPPPPPLHFDAPLAERIWASVGVADDPESWEHQRAEQPSNNGHTNGRAVARLCAIFADGGELDGVRFLSKALVDEASREQAFAEDPFFGPLRMGLGFGLDSEGFPAPTPTTFHWGGMGGSLACADQKTGVGFGYAMNNFIITADPVNEPRTRRLWDTLGEVMSGL